MVCYGVVASQNREQVNVFIRNRWFTTDMAIRGILVDLTKAEGFTACENGQIIGLITYFVMGTVCEITSLDSLSKHRGIGSALVFRVIEAAKKRGCSKIILVTTNDNLGAMRFYQKRGFDMAHLYRNALDASRRLKPKIPLTGDDGIPMKHEIEFEYRLSDSEARGKEIF